MKTSTQYIYVAIILMVLIAMLCSCRTTKTVYVPVNNTETKYIERLQRDSVYLHDSIMVDKSGDTIRLTKTQFKFRLIYLKDTVNVRDSIRIPYPVEKVVKVNEPTLWQKISRGLRESHSWHWSDFSA